MYEGLRSTKIMTTIAWKYAEFLRGPCSSMLRMRRRLPSYTIQKRFRSDLTIFDIDDKTGVATLTMNRPPVNALNADVLISMRTDLEEVQRNNARGLILTSSLRSVFSAGMDITELYTSDRERLNIIWSTLQDVMLLLSTLSIPTVALINGHSPGGGCVLATSCDYRIMLPNYTIGLNETALGLVPPKWVIETYSRVLPSRVAELALTKGKLFITEEAFKEGLVDEVVTDKKQGIERSISFLYNFKGVNPFAIGQTRAKFRFNDLFANRKEDLKYFVDHITAPHVHESIGTYLENLKKLKRK